MRICRQDFPSLAGSNYVSSILTDYQIGSSEVLYGNGNQLYRLNLKDGISAPLKFPDGLTGRMGPSILEVTKGKIWTESNIGIFQLELGKSNQLTTIEPEIFRGHLFTSGLSKMAKDREETIWIADQSSLISLPANAEMKGKVISHPFAPSNPYSYYGNQIEDLVICKDDSKWIVSHRSFFNGNSRSFLARLQEEGSGKRKLKAWVKVPGLGFGMAVIRMEGFLLRADFSFQRNPDLEKRLPMLLSILGIKKHI